ncbi:MAG: hypothetical protein NT117_13160 [Gammaproteobacteria bacterium]|nr:hypothetical protein [Gammaproteobacteria bacterium]
MKPEDIDREMRLQAAAEQAERLGQPAGVDPELDQHRLVIRALNRPTALQLPADFAARIAKRILMAEEKTSIEDWLMTLLLLGVGVVGLVYMQPAIALVVQRVHIEVPQLPWSMIAATGAGIAVAWIVDRGAARRFTSAG